MTSPITATAVTVMAPPPRPCSAREATSIPIDSESPHRTDPARNSRIATWKTFFRPKMSPSLPTTAVTIVEASR